MAKSRQGIKRIPFLFSKKAVVNLGSIRSKNFCDPKIIAREWIPNFTPLPLKVLPNSIRFLVKHIFVEFRMKFNLKFGWAKKLKLSKLKPRRPDNELSSCVLVNIRSMGSINSLQYLDVEEVEKPRSFRKFYS